MKHIALPRIILLAGTAAALTFTASQADARRHHPSPTPRPSPGTTPTPTATPTPTPRPTPPPSITATGSWSDCNTVSDTHSFASNSVINVSVTRTFTGTLNGSFTGTEYQFSHSGGLTLIFGNGMFTGTVDGKNGTFRMNYVGQIGSDDSYTAHWFIHEGTGDLARLLGEGTFDGMAKAASGGCVNSFEGTYDGHLVFADIPHR